MYHMSRKMATQEVLSNRDLVRNLIAQSTEGSHLLTTNKAIRDAQQPCTTHYEQWAEVGCPTQPESDEERDCLHSLGGLDSAFCQGTFDYTSLDSGWPMTHTDQPSSAVASRVLDLLAEKPTGFDNLTTKIALSLGTTTVRLQIGSSGNILTTTNQGWRRRGTRCRPDDEQVRSLLQTILTRTGTIGLPCLEGSQASGEVQIPRSIHIRVARWDEWMEQEWLLFHGQRT